MVLVDTGHGDPVARFQAELTEEEWLLVRDVILHRDAGFALPGGLDLLGPDLGDLPLVVLTAGRRDASPVPPDIAERLEQVRQDSQQELVGLWQHPIVRTSLPERVATPFRWNSPTW